MAEKKGPDTTSADYNAMSAYWDKVRTILAGTQAMRAAGERYLPRFPNETKKNYALRRDNAKFTNVFRDVCENLASKPFAKPVSVDEKTISKEIGQYVDNIDGAGNNLHVFAANAFFNGIAYSVDYILVDSTNVAPGVSLADEKRIGARPYFVPIEASRVVAAYTDIVDGEEQFVHVRILEPTVVRNGWEERTVERVRVYDRARSEEKDEVTGAAIVTYAPAKWELYEKSVDPNTREVKWDMVGKGDIRIGKIALVPFAVGRRKGAAWQFVPPMLDAADLQIEHYQQETNLKSAKELTCFPMLVGEGVAPAQDNKGKAVDVPIGPSAVLYAPQGKDGKAGTWKFLEPQASSLKFLADEIEKTEKQIRELGRQPLTAQSGNLTAIAAGVAASKGNSAVQAWTWGLKDALERALGFMALWLDDTSSKPVVNVYTDFEIEGGDGSAMDRVLAMRDKGDIDHDTVLNEAKRRGVLSADLDNDKVKSALANEAPVDPSAEDLIAALPPRPKPAKPPTDPPQRIAA